MYMYVLIAVYNNKLHVPVHLHVTICDKILGVKMITLSYLELVHSLFAALPNGCCTFSPYRLKLVGAVPVHGE